MTRREIGLGQAPMAPILTGVLMPFDYPAYWCGARIPLSIEFDASSFKSCLELLSTANEGCHEAVRDLGVYLSSYEGPKKNIMLGESDKKYWTSVYVSYDFILLHRYKCTTSNAIIGAAERAVVRTLGLW